MKYTFTFCILFATLVQPFIAICRPAMAKGGNKLYRIGPGASVMADSAVKSKIAQWMEDNGGLSFLENKGQMTDMEGNPVKDLLFKASGNSVDMYITTGGLSYVFTHKKILRSKKITESGRVQDSISGQYCRADMELVGADIRKENIVKEYESIDYNNYYIGQTSPALNVHSYKRVTIKNIYPGIDWVLYTAKHTRSASLEYDFVVHPGADPSIIKIRYKYPPALAGADEPKMQNDGSLKIKMPLGNILEGAPVTYQPCPNMPVNYRQASASVFTTYTLHKGEVGFAIAKYDKSKTLVIDPVLKWNLNWSTYYGSSGADVGNSIYNDGTDIWITGSTSSTGFPTLNPYQGTLTSGLTNVFILCFNATTGAPVWATYYGGTSTGESDAGEGISGDVNNIWVFAQVSNTAAPASTTFPTANPYTYNWYETYNTLTNTTTLNGTSPSGGIGNNAPAILEFQKSSGTRLYASYIAGSVSDYARSISDDGTHVWLTGTANSKNFPVLYSTGYYNSSGNGEGAFIIEYSTGGSLLWSTYFENSGANSFFSDASSICSDGTNVWLTGTAFSGTIPVNNPGGSAFYQGTDPTANACTFVAKFTIANIANNSQPAWSTFYGGNAGTSGFAAQSFDGGWSRTGFGQAIYSNGTNVWVTGATGSSDFATRTPALLKNPGGGAYYQSTNSVSGTVAGFHAFIAEFSASTCALEWGTYYGGSGTNPPEYSAALASDMGTSIQQDVNGNLWVAGETSSSNFPTMSFPCAYDQDNLGARGAQNAFLLEFNSSGVQQWATYLGGSGTDEANSLSSSGSGVWVTGGTTSSNFPLENLNGAYDQSTNGGGEDAFIAEFTPKPAMSATMGSTTNICNGSTTGSATVSVVNGQSPYTYSWTPVGSTDATATGLSAGSYTVDVTDATGCSATSMVTIIQSPPMLVNVGTITEPTCGGPNGSATITVSSGTTPYTYSWSPTGGTSATGTGLSAGAYRVYITDAASCTNSSTSIILTQPAPMTVTANQSTNISCNGGSNGTAIANITNGAAPFTYSWSPAGGTNATGTGFSAGTYTVTVEDNNQCSQSAAVTITQPFAIAGTISTINEQCYGYSTGSATVTPAGGTAPYNYLWNPTNQNSATANGLSIGTYTVTVTDATGCSVSLTASISQPVQSVVTFSSNVTQGCVPLCIQFNNTTVSSPGSTLSYTWTFGNGDTSHVQSPAYCYPSSGVFSVELTANNNGCNVTLAKANWVTVFSPPAAAFSYSPKTATIVSPAIQFTDHSIDRSGIIQWWWTFGDRTDSISTLQNTMHTYQDTGTYCTKLVVTDINGCTDTAINCLVIEPIFTLYIPDAFTPNGDGVNDVFMAKGDYVKNFEMYIFDKWGGEVFHSNNINDGWNGTANNGSTICREDTYVYKIVATNYQNEQHSYVGSITLMK